LAEEAIRGGADLVAAVGGDGTAREVAAGLVESDPVLCIVPAGTGNSSYRELFADDDWRAVLARGLDNFRFRQVDLNRVEPTGEYSLLGFSVGWFAQIVDLAAKDMTTTGRARYAVAAQRAAENPGAFSATVNLDGTRLADGSLGLIAVGGARMRGGVFPVLPDSRVDDGQLDVIVVSAASAAAFAELLQLVLTGDHRTHPLVHMGRGKSVSVTSGERLPVEVDGDLWERDIAECRVEVAPAALRVLSA
jgi:diacylglycerol kinase (ATP)